MTPDISNSPDDGPTASAPPVSRRLGPALIGAAFTAMLWFTWGAWADPLIDFGRELYVPWRLREGDVLYRDIWYAYGPASLLVNIGWFALLGLSYRSLVIGNVLVFASILVLLHRLLRRIASAFATNVALLFVVVVMGFGQYSSVSNYNYISPYSHEITHGLLFSLLALTALARYQETASRRTLALAGLVLGVVFLTKYEVFLALSGAVATSLLAFPPAGRRRPSPRHLALFVAAALTPPVTCLLVVARDLPLAEALRAVAGPYRLFFDRGFVSNPFFAESAGVTDSGAALAGIVAWSLFYAGLWILALLLGPTRLGQHPRLLAATAFVLPPAAILLLGSHLPWSRVAAPLPILLVLGVVMTLRAMREESEPAKAASRRHLALSVFALLLLLKTPLYSRITHYGFALAMPAVALTLAAAFDRIPSRLDRRGGSGRAFRFATAGFLVMLTGLHLRIAALYSADRVFAMGEGADTLRVDRFGAKVAGAVEMVRARVRPEETLVVLPEGAMVNYLARRRSSIPYLNFDPTTMRNQGEAAVMRSLAARPPDYVLALSGDMRSLQEYGCRVFGVDCAQGLAAWLQANYAPVAVADEGGRRPFTLFARLQPGIKAATEIIPLPPPRPIAP